MSAFLIVTPRQLFKGWVLNNGEDEIRMEYEIVRKLDDDHIVVVAPEESLGLRKKSASDQATGQ